MSSSSSASSSSSGAAGGDGRTPFDRAAAPGGSRSRGYGRSSRHRAMPSETFSQDAQRAFGPPKGYSNTTKAAAAALMLLVVAYGAHRFGLVDLSGVVGAVKEAYTFTASYIPPAIAEPAKQGAKFGIMIASTLTTTSVVLKAAKRAKLLGGLNGAVRFPGFSFDVGAIAFDTGGRPASARDSSYRTVR